MPINRPVTLIKMENITAPAQAMVCLVEIRKYFTEFKQSQPPMPTDILRFLPFDLHITEDQEDETKARIQILNLNDNNMHYDEKWILRQ